MKINEKIKKLSCFDTVSVPARGFFYLLTQTLAILKNKPIWKVNYQKSLSDIGYDFTTAIEYEKAVATIEEISAKVIDRECKMFAVSC